MNSFNKMFCAAGVCSMLAMVPVAQASADTTEQPGIAATARLSTLGYGAELDYPLNASWNIRLQVNGLNYDDTVTEGGIDYDGTLKLATQGLLVDFRPFSGTFKLTAGFFSNHNKLAASATSDGSKSYDIDGYRYAGALNNPLRLSAEAKLGKSSAGYLGFGWGHSYESGLSFSFELGALLSGKASATLSASGTAYRTDQPSQTFDVQGNTAAAQTFRQKLLNEQVELQDDLDDFTVYPVVAFGLGWRF